MRHILLSLSLLLPITATAQPELALPIDCTLGADCYIQQFTDRDPSPAASDFTCGPLSYDDHKGTDFALPTLSDQARGVAVLAAAGGIVRGVRDEMPDVLQGAPGAPNVEGRECGNGLVIDHGDGWETQYCHMARGSLQVSPGETVTQGQRLGSVGLSGQTEFPHLHLSVRHNGEVVDPFAPDGGTCGAPDGETLWITPPLYVPGGLIDAGFSTDVPEFDAIRAGLPPKPLARTAPIVLWTYIFGGRAGDTVSLTILGPDGGVVFDDDMPLDRTQAQLFRAGGRRAPPEGWPPGSYEGTATLIRDGAELSTLTVAITVP